MIVLTFAHKGEAQEFIRRKHTIAVEFYFKGLFRCEDELLLISGEGLRTTAERLTAVCTYYGKNIFYVLNLGIAGALVNVLQVNQIYGIHRIYLESLDMNTAKVYTTANQYSKYDCITARHPVLDRSYAQKLSVYAQIVDRELWACASVCERFKIPLKSYKLISDYADSHTLRHGIKGKAAGFSKHLFDFYKKLDLHNLHWPSGI